MNTITPEVLHKEIDLIQSCINRMSNNSFLIKGWTLSIVAIAFALHEADSGIVFISIILLFIITGFWYLDAYFLQIERMYRCMYTWTLNKRLNNDNSRLYDLNPYYFSCEVAPIWKIMFSNTLGYFYGMSILSLFSFILLFSYSSI